MSAVSQSAVSLTPSGMTGRTSLAISEALAGRLKGPRAMLAFVGPAVIESDSTTFVVPDGFETYLDKHRLFHLKERARG